MPNVIFAEEFTLERNELEHHTWPKGWQGEITQDEYEAAKKAGKLGEVVAPPAEATVAAAIAPALAGTVELEPVKPIPPIDVGQVLTAAHEVATAISDREAAARKALQQKRQQEIEQAQAAAAARAAAKES